MAAKLATESTEGARTLIQTELPPLPLGLVNLKACNIYFMKLQFVTANFGHHGLQFFTFVSQAIHETEKSE